MDNPTQPSPEGVEGDAGDQFEGQEHHQNGPVATRTRRATAAVSDRTPSDDTRPAAGRASGRVSIGTALFRYPILFVVIVVVVTAIAGATAVVSEPTYTAEARVLVGQVDVEARAVPGFTEATQELASIYARVVSTEAVVGPAAAGAGVAPATIRGGLDASPIPESSIIRVEVDSASEAEAIEFANAAAEALVDYANSQADADPTSLPVYERYQQAADELAWANVNEDRIEARLDALRDPDSPDAVATGIYRDGFIAEAEAELVTARSATLQAQLRADQLESEYISATRGLGDEATLELIAPAASQGNDRTTSLEIALLVGVAAGVLLGLAIVTLRANRRYLVAMRRRARSAS